MDVDSTSQQRRDNNVVGPVGSAIWVSHLKFEICFLVWKKLWIIAVTQFQVNTIQISNVK